MADEIEPDPGSLRPVCYQIRVRGRLDADWSNWFAGQRVTAEGDDTLLIGRMDQATLYGALKRVRDLGLPLISVLRLEEP